MALKSLELRKKADELGRTLTDLRKVAETFEAHETDLARKIEEATPETRDAVEAEVDALNNDKADNKAKIEELEEEIRNLEAEIEGLEREQNAPEPENREGENKIMETREIERTALADFIRGNKQTRTDYNMTVGNNGAVIGTTIAQEIVTEVANRSPLFEKAHRYNLNGNLDIPVFPASSSNVLSVAYGTEFTDLTASAGDFTKVSLTSFPVGSLCKISKNLVNRADIDVVPFVVEQMGEAFANFIEGELINGTTNKITGLSGIASGQTVTGASATAVTADELIDTQAKVKDAYQANCIWIMSPATRTAIRKLKDGENRYLLEQDFSAPWGWTLLGKPVYVSDQMDDMATGKVSIIYGDPSGLAVKIDENLEVEVLNETFATQHAVGVVGWMGLDATIENGAKFARFKNA